MARQIPPVVTRHKATIKSIAASLLCKGYVVGLSSQASEDRYRQYRGAEFDHYAILSDGWNYHEALRIEGDLQDYCKSEQALEDGLQDKYSPDAKTKSHHRSLGGKAQNNENEGSYHVYIAWWE